MDRKTFLLRAMPGKRDEVEARLRTLSGEILNALSEQNVNNFSIWGVEDLFFGYGEVESKVCAVSLWKWMDALSDCAEALCRPGTMRLMYQDIGRVREDKSLIRHRVFSTRLKPGCEEEYKRRHDALAAAREDGAPDGPDTNFTIWYGAGYIFGYCEKVSAFDHEMTESERCDTIAWENRQLEIMDWLTDDVDWMTGEKHESIRRII